MKMQLQVIVMTFHYSNPSSSTGYSVTPLDTQCRGLALSIQYHGIEYSAIRELVPALVAVLRWNVMTTTCKFVKIAFVNFPLKNDFFSFSFVKHFFYFLACVARRTKNVCVARRKCFFASRDVFIKIFLASWKSAVRDCRVARRL